LALLRHLEPYMSLSLPEIPSSSSSSSGGRLAPNSMQRAPMTRRAIDHELFQNLSHSEAQDFLEAQGDDALAPYVIRPSSKPGQLNVVWRVHKGVFVNIPVQEHDKPAGFALGRRLVVGKPFASTSTASADAQADEMAFEDLDELDANFLTNLVMYADELRRHRKFLNLRRDAVDQVLRREKRENPGAIPYYISVVGGGNSTVPQKGDIGDDDVPSDDEEMRARADQSEAAFAGLAGNFWLSYLPNTTVKHELIRPVVDGVRYRNRTFRSVDPHLLGWFKKNHHKPIQSIGVASSSASSGSSGSSAPSSGLDRALAQDDLARLSAAVGSVTGRPQEAFGAAPLPSYGGTSYGGSMNNPFGGGGVAAASVSSYGGDQLQRREYGSVADPRSGDSYDYGRRDDYSGADRQQGSDGDRYPREDDRGRDRGYGDRGYDDRGGFGDDRSRDDYSSRSSRYSSSSRRQDDDRNWR
jgi:SH2 domain